MDILFQNVALLPMDGINTVIHNAYVGVTDGKISYVATTKPAETAGRVINGEGKALLPGLVNAHTHVPMTLLRGYADDFALQEWLFDHIFPAEEKLTGEMCRIASQLAMLEMLAFGTTSFTDMYFFTPFIAAAVVDSGLKANLCRPMAGGEDYDPKTDQRLADADALRAEFHGFDNGRIRIDASVHAEYTSCPKVWETCAEFAAAHKLRVHTHVSETRREHEECLARYGQTPTAMFARHGLLDRPVTAAHCVHVSPEDIDILREKGVTAVLNPVSNLKLNSGVAPLPALLSAGVNTALGTDGMASNNSHNLFEEIKLSALLHQEPTRLGAVGALTLATVNGAMSQGREDEAGQIVPGKDADIILVDLDSPHLTPAYNLPSALCYAATGSDVSLTMVRGRILYENGVYTTLDKEKVLSESRRISDIFSSGRA